jgi:2-beta-glucuronyltransferase
MHWLADELIKSGWHVRFVSVGYSRVSILVGDRRLQSLGQHPKVGLRQLGEHLEGYFRFSLFHPVSLRSGLLNRFAGPLFALFPTLWHRSLRQLLADARLVVIESGIPVTLSATVRNLTDAKLVYRVNDDVRLLGMPPFVIEAENKYACLFDRISLASPVLAQRFAKTGAVAIDPMGLEKGMFDKPHADPFLPRWEREVVCAGTTQFDLAAVLAMAQLRPTWRFHIIGRWNKPEFLPNIVWLGEIPFARVVPYVQHADIGLGAYRSATGVEYQTHHSNRILQYTYMRLPVLVPQAMVHSSLPHLIGYDATTVESLDEALRRIATYERSTILDIPPGWEQLARGISSVCDEYFRPDAAVSEIKDRESERAEEPINES